MSAHFLPGTTLADGRYRVVRLLGAGGMGSVYEAENTTTRKRVAIKCLRPGHNSDDIDGARLVREAKASARIRHPNVVDVYDVVRSGSFVCLVMEYLDGEPLSSLLERGRLSVASALALLVPVLRGVGAAHRQGVVHRDIKPANIFLAREEDAPSPVPKLLDFGVSKLGEPGVDSLVLTRSGQIVGTPLYMPLEQFMGEKDIDARADIYALGVVLYEALTGRPPYRAESLAGLIVQLTSTSPVPPHLLSPEVPEQLGEVVMRALARDRAERFGSVEAMLTALVPFTGAAATAALQQLPNPQHQLGEAATLRGPNEGIALRSTGAAGHAGGSAKKTRIIIGVTLATALGVLLTGGMLRDIREQPVTLQAVPSAPAARVFPATDAPAASPPIASATASHATLLHLGPDDAGASTHEQTVAVPSLSLRAEEPDSSTPHTAHAVAPSSARRDNRRNQRVTPGLSPHAQTVELPTSMQPTGSQDAAPTIPSHSGDPTPLRIRVPDSDEF